VKLIYPFTQLAVLSQMYILIENKMECIVESQKDEQGEIKETADASKIQLRLRMNPNLRKFDDSGLVCQLLDSELSFM